jgi:hypothetical protein
MASNDKASYEWKGEEFTFHMVEGSKLFEKKAGDSKASSAKDVVRERFNLCFKDMPDYVKQVLQEGTKTGAYRKLVVWAHWAQPRSYGNKPGKQLFCIGQCLEVEEKDDDGILRLHCKMLAHSGNKWQLKRPSFNADGTPKENVRIQEISDSGSDLRTECWILPPLIVHVNVAIYSLDTVDTVNQTCSADFYYEFRLRGISEVRGICLFGQHICVVACLGLPEV